MKRVSTLPIYPVGIDRRSKVPVYRQLYEELRQLILEGRYGAGARLPSTRNFASEYKLSRSTVIIAFEQLLSEGYLTGRIGSGTYISEQLPESHLHVGRSGGAKSRRSGKARVSKTVEMLVRSPVVHDSRLPPLPFRPGMFAPEMFPLEIWAKLSARRWRQAPKELLLYGNAAGYLPLREAIAEYARESRGVRCEPEQVIIVNGSQQGVMLASHTVLNAGDKVWMEDPGYSAARGSFMSARAHVIPIPIDDQGIDVAYALKRAPKARLAFVTPSYQHPLGITMSLKRRFELLDWAESRNAWIIEDDYDAEFRYSGRPVTALQGLDESGRVIYIGTFSKAIMPGIRIGYCIAPIPLVEGITELKRLTDTHSPLMNQAVLRDFLVEGHFARHLRSMREVYAKRQTHLVAAVRKELDEWIAVEPAENGMHLVGKVKRKGVNVDSKMSRAAAKSNIVLTAVSDLSIGKHSPQGVMMGYTSFSQAKIVDATHRLRAVLERM